MLYLLKAYSKELIITKAESIAIRDELIKLQEEGRQLEIACALCYVESARMKSPEQIQKFLNDAGQKVREFFGAKAKSDVVTAEENIRKKQSLFQELLI